MNRTQAIIDTLRAAGLEAFWPGVHEGVCRAPYCVVHSMAGTLLCPAGGSVLYRVHLFVPAHSPEELDALALAVREALAPARNEGWLMLAQPRGVTRFDDTFRAACSYIDYVSYYSETGKD